MEKIDAVLNVAGGFAMATASSEDLLSLTENMVNSSLHSSIIAARIAHLRLKAGGLLLFPGAAVWDAAIPVMLAYVPAKAAVHSLARCLAADPVQGTTAYNTDY